MPYAWAPWALLAVMLLTSVLAYARAPAGARLAMQWGLDGKVTWRAPRLAAVLFTPALACLILLATQALAPAGRAAWVGVFIMAAIAAAHAGHLVFALRDVEARR